MLSLLTYFGIGLLGFGIGGISLKGFDKKEIVEKFDIFKKAKENEISQIKKGNQKQNDYVLELTKENIEIQKQYNKSIGDIEVLNLSMKGIQAEIKQKITKKTDKETISTDDLETYFQ